MNTLFGSGSQESDSFACFHFFPLLWNPIPLGFCSVSQASREDTSCICPRTQLLQNVLFNTCNNSSKQKRFDKMPILQLFHQAWLMALGGQVDGVVWR